MDIGHDCFFPAYHYSQILNVFDLKVLTNEKRGGLRIISLDRSPFKLFSRKFSKESVPHRVRGIKPLSEPCFYYLHTMIDSQ
jgi:hypothetical protein